MKKKTLESEHYWNKEKKVYLYSINNQKLINKGFVMGAGEIK